MRCLANCCLEPLSLRGGYRSVELAIDTRHELSPQHKRGLNRVKQIRFNAFDLPNRETGSGGSRPSKTFLE